MKKFVTIGIITIVIAVIAFFVYNLIFDASDEENATKIYDKGVAAMHKNHYMTARLAFEFVVEKYPESPLVTKSEEYLKAIDLILKRYFVYVRRSSSKNNLTNYRDRLSNQGIYTSIISTNNFPSFPKHQYLLLVDRFEKLKDAEVEVDRIKQHGIKVYLKKAY